MGHVGFGHLRCMRTREFPPGSMELSMNFYEFLCSLREFSDHLLFV